MLSAGLRPWSLSPVAESMRWGLTCPSSNTIMLVQCLLCPLENQSQSHGYLLLVWTACGSWVPKEQCRHLVETKFSLNPDPLTQMAGRVQQPPALLKWADTQGRDSWKFIEMVVLEPSARELNQWNHQKWVLGNFGCMILCLKFLVQIIKNWTFYHV